MIDVSKTDEFDHWLLRLKNPIAKAKIISRIQRLAVGNSGDTAPVGEGVGELRVHTGPGYRVYYKQTNTRSVVLLCGGDKATQDKDIKKAKQLAASFEKDDRW